MHLPYDINAIAQSKIKYAIKLCGNEDDAKDLVQDTILKFLLLDNKPVDFTHANRLMPILMNQEFVNQYRAKHTVKRTFDQSCFATISNPEAYGKMELKDTLECIHEMAESRKMILSLNFQGFGQKEISEIIGRKRSYVGAHIFQGQKRLLELIK